MLFWYFFGFIGFDCEFVDFLIVFVIVFGIVIILERDCFVCMVGLDFVFIGDSGIFFDVGIVVFELFLFNRYYMIIWVKDGICKFNFCYNLFI